MNRRKRKLVRVDLQLRVIFITLFVACFVLLIHFQLLLTWLARFAATVAADATVDSVLEQTRTVILQRFLVSLAIALPLSVAVAVLYSFRFSGPIYRFKAYLTDLVTGGRWDRAVTLRKGDQLTDVADALNRAVSVFSDHVRTSHAILQETEALWRDLDPPADPATRERMEEIRESILQEAKLFEARLGTPDEPSETPQDAESHVATPEAASAR